MIERHTGSVIVVDDDPDALKITSLVLKKKGYSVSACSSAREALDVMQKNNIDVVLTDIMMPEMSGIELLERIHSTDPDIPVILVTGFADLDKAIEAIKKGAFDFITKPYENVYLTHSIEKAVRYHRLVKMEAGYRQILEELNAEVETLITERTMGLMALTVADRVRNPATTIAWTCKRILKKEDAPERLKEGLNIILSEAERLEAIVKDFQELFKTRGASFKHGEIKGVVEGVISVAEKEALHKGIDLTVHISEEPLRLNMESNILRMALIHLVRNAIEATPTGGSVVIKTYGDNEKVVVEVSDTGPGIPKEEIDRVFDPFFSTKKNRFGMGLSLVKQIVSEHLGEIGVGSEMGKGTTFKLIFPVRWTERLTVRETSPFDHFTPSLAAGTKVISPYASRIEVLWRSMREQVQEIFPEAPGIPDNPDDYIRKVDEIYVNDAYNSLSIEGYMVTPELIEKIRTGEWDPADSAADRQQRDVMAAKGYNLAFQSVKESIRKILRGKSPVEVISIDHQEWYKQMFLPSVQAGFSKMEALIGYRNAPVYIQGSQHVPPSSSAVVDCMETLFDLLKVEREAGIRAVLGHFIFVFIHPYMDGNGRIGRFLMNTMFASGGFPWTVIRVERRAQYMSALEEASVRGNIRPFAEFIKGEMDLALRARAD